MTQDVTTLIWVRKRSASARESVPFSYFRNKKSVVHIMSYVAISKSNVRQGQWTKNLEDKNYQRTAISRASLTPIASNRFPSS